MIRLSNQPQNQNKNYKDFSTIVNEYLKVKRITQSDLIKLTLLSKTTISRVCRNSNDKGATYIPTFSVVMAISIGLKLTRAETEQLFFAAFPEMELLGYFLDKKMDIDQANEILYDNGLPLLGNIEE